MGRSVSYPTGAIVTFDRLAFEEDEDEEAAGGFAYDAALSSFQSAVCAAYPSVCAYSGWRGNEDRIVARNAFADFGVSEYGGLLALWVAPRDDNDSLMDLGRCWLRHIAHRFVDRFGTMTKVGTFSNGGGVYAPKVGTDAPEDNLGEKPGHVVIGGLLTDG